VKNIRFFLDILNKKLESPFEKRLSDVVASFTPKEQIIFFIFIIFLFAGTVGLLWKVNQTLLVKVPAEGGTLTEGIVGTPRFINPILAISDADRDMTALVYSGLMRATENGVLKTDLAENLEVSADGLIYTFTLKEGLVWHDSKPVTADDVIFTIKKAQDTTLRSPKRASWDGVLVEKINNSKIRFTLEQPYAPFLENTTIGILPKHLWQDVDSEQFGFSKYNVEPVGTGPYSVEKIKKDDAGIPQYYSLVSFKKFASGEPYINNIKIRFYANTDILLEAFNSSEIESMSSISPDTAEILEERGYRIEKTPFPRVFGVFFNQNQASIFTDKAVRRALNVSLNKKKIIDEILHGYATVIDSPIPPGALGYSKILANDKFSSHEERVGYARNILEENGWEFDAEENVMIKKTKKDTAKLAFSISTSEVPELKEAANTLKEIWEELGAKVEVKVFEIGDLNQNIIRPREYDALLFGEVVGRDSDLFAFWHSSQRLDPGLNIAMYANITADGLLEDARKSTDIQQRHKKYRAFNDEVLNDTPAVFLYSPDFIYVLPKNIKGVEIENATTPSERFLNIPNWYIETDSVWKIFANN